jgi:exopolysaccharide biosynthesis polyprenyl glycosylphosphotransferase
MVIARRYKYYMAASDFLVLSISAFFFVFFESWNINLNQGFITGNINSEMILFPFVLAGMLIFLISESNHLYNPDTISKSSGHNGAIIRVVLYTSAGLIALAIISGYKSMLYSFMLIGNFTVAALLLLYLYRVIIVAPLYKAMNVNINNILIVGDQESARELSSRLININSGMSLAGYVESGTNGKSNGHDKKYLGTFNQMGSIIKENNIKEILIAYNNNDYSGLFEIITKCKEENLPLKIKSPLFKIVEQKLTSEKYCDVPVISLSLKNTFYTKYGKRILDITGALIGLLLLSPLFLILAIIIKSTSPGPVFFKQQRIDKNGKVFMFYKFRSMYQVAEEDKERAEIMKEFINKEKIESGDAKVVNTARVTKIGKLIRKTSVDELPQFYNVLKGDMSLVGPRPEVPYVYEMYKNWQKQRVNGLPGCTGVWQVTARSSVTFNEMVMLDIYYLNNISFKLDMAMILKTIPVMLFAKGGR